MSRVDKIKAQKMALLEKLKELQKEESKAASADKQLRRKSDDRTKLLFGIAAMAYIRDTPAAGMLIAHQAEKLSPSDRKFLATSELWKELGLPVPTQDAAKPQGAAKNAPQAAQAAKPAYIPVEPPKTPPAASQAAPNIAQTVTPLPKVSYYDKDAVKVLGAKYDADAKKWFAPAGIDLTPLAKWL